MNFPDPDTVLLYIDAAQQGTQRGGKGEETYGRYFQQSKKYQAISG
jgi:hypothetical protein